MPSWALKLAASLVLAMTLTGSVQYVSAHPKNAFAPLQPAVALTGDEENAPTERDLAIEELREQRRLVSPRLATPFPPPTPNPSPTPTPRASTAAAARTVAPTARPATAAPTVAAAAPARPTLAAGVRTATLPPLTRTKVS